MVQGDAMATSLVETWAMALTGLFNPLLAQFTRPEPLRLSFRHFYRGPNKYKHVMNLAMGILLNLEHAAEVAFSTRPLTTLFQTNPLAKNAMLGRYMGLSSDAKTEEFKSTYLTGIEAVSS